jgi:hypothetical protein
VGNGHRVRFWEDLWVGSCSLAIQYWGLYMVNILVRYGMGKILG